MGVLKRSLLICGAVAVLAFPGEAASAATTFTVTTVLDTVDANPADGICADAGGQCSLRAAVMQANSSAGADTIIVPPGTYTLMLAGRDENASATGDLDITDAVTIIGAGGNPEGDPGQTIIQGGVQPGTSIDKVFSVNPTFDKAFATEIKALTIRHGKNTSSRSGDGYGGGLDWEASGTGTLTIYNCIITNNTVADGDGGGLVATNTPGGAAALLTIAKTQITSNEASNGIGGGVFIGTNTAFAITDSVISNNTVHSGTSSTGSGAGIFIFGPEPAGTHPSISGSVIADNQGIGSGGDGGGIYTTMPLTITNTTISGNSVGRNGGGIHSSLVGGSVNTFTNVTISGNTAGGKGGGYSQAGLTTGAPGQTTMTNVTITGNRGGTGGGLHREGSVIALTLRNTIVAGNFQGATTTANDVSGVMDAASSFNLIGTGGAGGLSNGTNGNQVGVANPRLSPLADNGGLSQTHALLAGSPALDAGSAALVTAVTDQRGAGHARVADAADSDTAAAVDIGAFEAHPAVEDIGDRTGLAGQALSVTFNVGDAAQGIAAVTAVSNNPGVTGPLVVGAGPSPSTRTLTLTPAQAGSAVITVTAAGAGSSMSDTFGLTVTAPANLAIAKSHSSDFRQGQQGATYTITVTNAGGAATDGSAVTVTESLPSGLTAVSMAGSGWTCPAASCTRNDVLAVGASYPPITLTVNVDNNAPADITNTVTVTGGGDTTPGNNTASDPTTVVPVADLTVLKSHTGNLAPGMTGATFTMTVTNLGPGATTGTVTVTDTLPAELTAVSMAGPGWTCTGLTCTRSDELAAGASYPPVTLTVDVAAGALGSVTNQVTVAGGGELNTANDTAFDLALIVTVPDLEVSKSHSGDFRQGQVGATYTLTVSNAGTAATTAPVTVTDNLPAGLTATGMSGDGWTCDFGTVTCTRSDALAAGVAYQAITVTVNVAADAPATLTNSVTVTGDGGTNTASDPTTVIAVADLTVAKAHTGDFEQGQAGAAYMLTVTNSGAGPTVGEVTVADLLPADLTVTGIAGTGWTCDLGALACTRSDELAAGAAYPVIVLTVQVAANAPASVTNEAQVSGGGDVNPANNTAQDVTAIGSSGGGGGEEPPAAWVTIDPPVTETREASISLTGRANPNATVHVGTASVQADAGGQWSAAVALVEGPNLITVTNGSASASVTVVRDSTPPVLQLTAAATETEAETVLLTATSEPDAVVKIEGQEASTLTVPLALGSNTFTATATDRLGNQATASVTVVRVTPPPPETPPSLDSLPAEVEQPALTVSGTAMAGTEVTLLVNGSAQGTTAVSAAGHFALNATLAEGQNRIVVRSASGLSSGEAMVVYRRPLHFTDVAGHWAESAIYRMARAGVVEGFPDETFRPEESVTRLQFALMSGRLLGLAPVDEALPFADADQIPEWARQQLAAAVKAGIVTGHDDGRFAPDDLVTRAEAATIVVRAMNYVGMVTTGQHITFTDEDQIPAWAFDAVHTAARAHVIIGYEDGTFRADAHATRAEAVTMLDRLLSLFAR